MIAKSKCRACELKFTYDFSGHKRYICPDCRTKPSVIKSGIPYKRDPQLDMNNYMRRMRIRFTDAIYQFIQLYENEVYADKRKQGMYLAKKYEWIEA